MLGAIVLLISVRSSSGVSNVPIDWLTDDGYDMTFGVNVIGTSLHCPRR